MTSTLFDRTELLIADELAIGGTHNEITPVKAIGHRTLPTDEGMLATLRSDCFAAVRGGKPHFYGVPHYPSGCARLTRMDSGVARLSWLTGTKPVRLSETQLVESISKRSTFQTLNICNIMRCEDYL